MAYLHRGPNGGNITGNIQRLGGTPIDPILAVALIAWIAVFGSAAWRLAKRRDRRPPTWFAFGAALGPIALALLLAAPPGRCRSCLTPTRGWLMVCLWCHQDVRVVPRQTQALLARMSHSQARVAAEASRARPEGKERPRPAIAAPIARPSLTPPPHIAATQPSGFGLPRVQGIARVAPTPQPAVADLPAKVAPAATRAPIPSPTPTQAPPPTHAAHAPVRTRSSLAGGDSTLPSGTYIAGSSTLEPGRRYAFNVDGQRLQLLGPIEIDSTAIALQLDIREMDATSVAGRLLISQPAMRSGPVLAFMSIAGSTPDELVNAIVEAARAARNT